MLIEKEPSPVKKKMKSKKNDSSNYPIRASFEGRNLPTKIQKNSDDESLPTDHTSIDKISDDNSSESGSSDFSGSSISESSDGLKATKARLIRRKGLHKFCLHLNLLL